MKKFLKMFFAALLAVMVGSLLSGFMWLMVFIGMAASMEGVTTVPHGSVLVIDLSEDITDRPDTNPLSHFDMQNMSMRRTLSLYDALKAVAAAAEDERICGIYLRPDGSGTISAANLEELRAAVEQFKLSGKFVVAYNEHYSQTGYWFASVADEVYIHPQGGMTWQGLSFTLTFYKGLLDKLNIEAEIFRPTSCKYKSAVEPYFLTRMSDANRRQMSELAESMWNTVLEDVSRARDIPVAELRTLAEKLAVVLPEDAVKYSFADDMLYEDDVELWLEELGASDDGDGFCNRVSLGDYARTVLPDKPFSKNKIAIIYAEGDIVDGSGDEEDTVYGLTLAEKIRRTRTDDDVCAVVLRVNSPGGSALASDVIWHEVCMLRSCKPVIVSMGAYAASGGYYISVPADVIVTDKLTLTGSIGVFGLAFDAQRFFNNKLGVTFDVVKTNASADMGSMVRSLTPAERTAIMRGVDKVYDTFTSNVAEGRNLTEERVLELAGGRVWSGTEAVQTGLADVNGGLLTAIAVAADKAAVSEDYTVEEIVDAPEGWAAVVSALNARITTQRLQNEIGADLLRDYNALRRLSDRRGVQTYCPYAIRIE